MRIGSSRYPPRSPLPALQAVGFQEAGHRGEADGDALGGERGVEAAGADVRMLLQQAEDPRALLCYERRALAFPVRADGGGSSATGSDQ